jgi:hypothetical protein
MRPIERTIPRVATTLLCVGLLAQPALAQFTQQGPKLVGTGAQGVAQQGFGVALSADGNTAIVGGPQDNNNAGAAWVFTSSGGVWSQQGNKLVVNDAIGAATLGFPAALSADGNTAIVGGTADNNLVGAAWVFTRSGGAWSEQAKLVGNGAGQQGFSVALSADGNTAIVGGPNDNNNAGAAWVFTRSGGVWSQQAKLVGSGAVGAAFQGTSVALSADGNTAIVGGPQDNNNAGAAWVWTRSGGVWGQQAKLVAMFFSPIGNATQGYSVALSADGNTAIVGGPLNNSGAGAAWVWTRSGGVWSEKGQLIGGASEVGSAHFGSSVAVSGGGSAFLGGNTAIVGGIFDNNSVGAAWVYPRSGFGTKLVGTGAVGPAQQGRVVALSTLSCHSTAVVGGPFDNGNAGAAWVFVASPIGHDFNGDCASDILWRNNTNGGNVMWLMNGAAITSSLGLGNVTTDWSIVGQRDFNGDGFVDIVWRNSNGGVAMWLMDGGIITSSLGVGNVPSNWVIAGTGDFNSDGRGDILWRDTNGGGVAMWLMDGGTIMSSLGVGTVPTNWVIAGVGDFNRDGYADILWRDSNNGGVVIWLMNGGTVMSSLGVGTVPTNWVIAGIGDFNGDGMADILWRDNNSGGVAMWLMNGATVGSSFGVGNVPNNWQIAQTGDYNDDGMSDVLWRDTTSGGIAMWLMNGATINSSLGVGNVPTDWRIQGLNAD